MVPVAPHGSETLAHVADALQLRRMDFGQLAQLCHLVQDVQGREVLVSPSGGMGQGTLRTQDLPA